METITIPKSEYIELLELYKKIQIQFDKITEHIYDLPPKLDASKYCGAISLKKDAMTIQNELRNEWE